MTDARVEVIERGVVFDGFFKLVRYPPAPPPVRRRDEPRCSARELFERGDAAVVLPYDPLREEIVLVEQFRLGALERAGDPWLLEPVAGIIEPGEAPPAVARREAAEEAGLELLDLVPIGSYFPSPGAQQRALLRLSSRGSTAAAPAGCSASPTMARTSRPMWCRSRPRSAGSRTAGCGSRAR